MNPCRAGGPFAILFFLMGVFCALPAQSSTPSTDLDQQQVHQHYTEGDFDKVRITLQEFSRLNPVHSLEDSIFIAKYLAVVYAANPATREMGRSYMFRLLKLQPTAKIVDLFVSEDIDRIFEKTKEEFVAHQETLKREAQKKDLKKSDETGDKKSKTPLTLEKKPRARTWLWVTGGITLAVAGGTLVYFLTPSNPKNKYYELPE